jgi:16S rRNA (guanine527-N7)-methyltransferase
VADPARSHRPHLEARGLVGAAADRLERYLDLLAAWSARLNLTGARTPAARVSLLVAPILPAVPLPAPGPLIDVGSGNGSPGLVLALLRPDLQATLLEPRQKRWAFLREAARAAGRPDVHVLRARHDQYVGAPASTVTLRALALDPVALTRLVAPGGQVLRFGPPGAAGPGWTRSAAGDSVWAYRRHGSP